MQMKDIDKTATPTVGSGPNSMYDMSKVNESTFKVSSALLFVVHNLCVYLVIFSH